MYLEATKYIERTYIAGLRNAGNNNNAVMYIVASFRGEQLRLAGRDRAKHTSASNMHVLCSTSQNLELTRAALLHIRAKQRCNEQRLLIDRKVIARY